MKSQLRYPASKSEELRFVGRGPKATGQSGGWEFKKEIYLRCPRCGEFLHPWALKKNEGCSCGGLFFDVDCCRFAASGSDESIEVFQTK